MSSMSNYNNRSRSSNDEKKGAYEAFQAVDTLVSKPVFGSDGAASWQEFQKDQKVVTLKTESVAPKLPRKRNDVFSSAQEERLNEIQIRKDTNQPDIGSGYTAFQKRGNNNNDDANTRKRQRMIEQRIRTDDQLYFISSSTFTGWKQDYIFTTREGRGTGYYWDGMDSLKEQQQQQLSSTAITTTTTTTETTIQPKKKKKKKKSKEEKNALQQQKSVESIINPMDQVKNAIQQRQELQQHSTYNNISNNESSSTLPNGWNEAIDPTTKKTYYYQSLTGKRQWEKPTLKDQQQQQKEEVKMNNTTRMNIQSIELAALTGKKIPTKQKKNNDDDDWEEIKDETTQKLYYYQKSTGKRQWDNPKLPILPDGWKSIVDTDSGKTYYYHEQTKQTSWDRPKL